jgi:hypothetical protein
VKDDARHGAEPSSHLATPPWREQVPVWVLLCEYRPSLHWAIAPVASVVSEVPDLPAFVAVVVAAFDDDVVGLVAAGAGAAGAAAAGAGAAGATAPAELVVATPPWCEQAPRPAVPLDPSLQVTAAPVDAAGAAAAGAGAVAAGAVAVAPALATPPWCEHAPRPAVPAVPSLHVTAVPASCARATPVAAAAHTNAQATTILICILRMFPPGEVPKLLLASADSKLVQGPLQGGFRANALPSRGVDHSVPIGVQPLLLHPDVERGLKYDSQRRHLI